MSFIYEGKDKLVKAEKVKLIPGGERTKVTVEYYCDDYKEGRKMANRLCDTLNGINREYNSLNQRYWELLRDIRLSNGSDNLKNMAEILIAENFPKMNEKKRSTARDATYTSMGYRTGD